jgi:hypothetical protein
MPDQPQQIIVYARMGMYATERIVCDTVEEAHEAIDQALRDAAELENYIETSDQAVLA